MSNNISMEELWTTLEDNFNFFRSYLSDEVDAIVTYFISEQKMSDNDLVKLDAGIQSAITKLVAKYGHKLQPNQEDGPIIPDELRYSLEPVNCLISFNVFLLLTHIKYLTSTLLSLRSS